MPLLPRSGHPNRGARTSAAPVPRAARARPIAASALWALRREAACTETYYYRHHGPAASDKCLLQKAKIWPELHRKSHQTAWGGWTRRHFSVTLNVPSTTKRRAIRRLPDISRSLLRSTGYWRRGSKKRWPDLARMIFRSAG